MANDLTKTTDIEKITKAAKSSTLEMYRDITMRMPALSRAMADIAEDDAQPPSVRVQAFRALADERKAIYESLQGKDGKEPFMIMLEEMLRDECRPIISKFKEWSDAGCPTVSGASVLDTQATLGESQEEAPASDRPSS